MLSLKWRRCYFLYTYLSKSLRQSRSNLIFYMKISSKSWGGISTAVYFCFCFSPNNLLHLLVGCFVLFFLLILCDFLKYEPFVASTVHIYMLWIKYVEEERFHGFQFYKFLGNFMYIFLKLRNYIFFSKINNVIFITLIFKNS